MKTIYFHLAVTFLLFEVRNAASLPTAAVEDVTNMALEDAIKFLQQKEINDLEETINQLTAEKGNLVAEHSSTVDELNEENDGILKKITDELEVVKQTSTNQEVLLSFMKKIVFFNDATNTSCMDSVQAQAEQLAILGAERKEYEKKNELNLKQAYLQVDVIKSQEREKDVLKQTIKEQKKLYDDYGNLTNFDNISNMDDFPVYAQFLTKTLADQADKIKQMSQHFEDEKQVEENMVQILEEIQSLNFSLATQASKWDMVKEYQNIITLQDANLKSLAPILTYIVEDHKRYNYNLNEEGALVGMEPCQCLPEAGDSGVEVTEIEFTCPNGTVSATSLEADLTIKCPGGDCPEEVDAAQCGDFDALPWSSWKACTDNTCLVDSIRERKIRKDGIVSKEFQGNGSQPLIVTASSKFNIYLPEGSSLGVFAMGGGGGADDSVSGSSGFFSYEELFIAEGTTYNIDVNIGQGGDNRAGKDTVVNVASTGADFVVTAGGGGYAGASGWSGGSSEKGGWNGSSGSSKSNGNGTPLPGMCGSATSGVTLEAGQTGDYDNDGTGGGGVVVNGQKPYHRYYRDGYGYGAGGGEDDYDGSDGVAVIVLCYV